MAISIHASRGGSDVPVTRQGIVDYVFQSTLPAGEATARWGMPSTCPQDFNPRFPRGKRRAMASTASLLENFNPRFPRGKRPRFKGTEMTDIEFQSTLPAGEATRNFSQAAYGSRFQSTLPAGEATRNFSQAAYRSRFQSTLPAGEATPRGRFLGKIHAISIQASRGGSDLSP